MPAIDRDSPPDPKITHGGRAFSRLPEWVRVGGVLVVVAVVSAVAVDILRARADTYRRDATALLQVEMMACRLNALACHAVHKPRTLAENQAAMAGTRQEMLEVMDRLSRQDSSLPGLAGVRASFAAYHAAMEEGFLLLAAGDFSSAEQADETKVAPGFVRFLQQIRAAAGQLEIQITRIQWQTRILTYAIILAGACAVGVLYARFHAARRAADLAAVTIERRVLRQANAELEARVRARTVELAAMNDRLSASLHGKETLLREVHHRVKNNLQIISSLLHFRGKKLHDPAALAVFGDARALLRSMMLVHEKLYGADGLAAVDFADYLHSLVDQLKQSPSRSGSPVSFRVEAARLSLPIELALPAALIVTELVTNILKYAYPGERGGEARIRLTAPDGRVRITVSDDGVGLPPGFDPENHPSFGWQLVRNLVAQLLGTCELRRGRGTEVIFSFPRPPPPA